MIVWFIFLALSLCATSQPLCDTTKNPNRVVTFSTNYLCEDLCVALDTDSNITFLNKDTVAKYVYLPGNYSGVSECDSFVSERENITISPNQSFSYEVGQNWLRNVSKIDQLNCSVWTNQFVGYRVSVLASCERQSAVSLLQTRTNTLLLCHTSSQICCACLFVIHFDFSQLSCHSVDWNVR